MLLSVSISHFESGIVFLIVYAAGAISQSFQEGNVLFGVTLLLQIANYFKGKKVQLRIITILIMAKMGRGGSRKLWWGGYGPYPSVKMLIV